MQDLTLVLKYEYFNINNDLSTSSTILKCRLCQIKISPDSLFWLKARKYLNLGDFWENCSSIYGFWISCKLKPHQLKQNVKSAVLLLNLRCIWLYEYFYLVQDLISSSTTNDQLNMRSTWVDVLDSAHSCVNALTHTLSSEPEGCWKDVSN